MKKVLSLALALILTLSCLGTDFYRAIALSSEAVLSDPNDNMITIFDSNAYVTDDKNTTHTNPATDGFWLGGNSWLSSNTKAQDSLYMGANGESAKILERNNPSFSNVDDFEWQFQLIADNSSTVNTSFVFHVGENGNISSYASRNNLFAVTLFGSEVDQTKNCAVTNALVIEYGGNGFNNNGLGNMRPFDYNSSVSPWEIKDNSYLKLDDLSADEKIDLTKYITVKIKMEGRKITVSVWQSKNKEDTYRELSLDMYASVVNKFKGGDFAIISGAATSNYRIKDMNISTPREIFNSSEYPAPDHINTEIKTDTDSGLWLQNGRISTIQANKDRIYMDSWKTTNEILSRNKADTSELSDFEWKFDFLGNGADTRAAFLFHTNDNSNLTDYWQRSYAFSLMVWGSAWSYEGTSQKAATDYAMPNSIAVQIPMYTPNDSGMMGKPRPLGGYAKDETTLKFKHTSADSYLELGSIDISKWATITIKLVGNKLTLTVSQGTVELTKEFTLPENNLNLAPAGDFAIIQGGNQSGYRNMTVKTLAADIDVPKPEEPKDYEELPDTGIYYKNDFETNSDGIVLGSTPKYPEESGIKTESNGNKFMQLGHDYSNANGNDGWSVIKINPDKKYKDFTLNFNVKLDAELHKTFLQNWHYMLVGFRSENGVVDSNVLQISALGAAFSVADASENKDYTNNRIAYAGTDSTLDGTFSLPNGNAKAGISPDSVWHKVSVVVDGWTYKYYLDGVLMIEVEDTEKTYDKGSIVLMGRTINFKIDNVEILSPDAEISYFEPVQTETGLLYENTFENDGDADRLTIVRGQNYSVIDADGKKYFHIDYEPNESNAANGPVNMTFGPSGIKDFTLSMNVRITKQVSDKWHPIILMGRTKSGGISAQARLFTKGTYLNLQSDKDILEIARSGPAAENTTSIYPCHDEAAGVSILEWHKVSLVCEDWKYTVYIDGKKILEGVDEHQLNKWGGFGLRTEGVNLDIDNIRIYGTPHYDLAFTEEVPTGILYENDFESSSIDGLNFVYHDDEKTGILTEESGNKFLRAYPNMRVKEDGKLEVVGNGNLLITFGPPNAMDFELNFKLRVKSNTNENLGSTIVGIHSKPSNIKWDSVWMNILARGTSVSLKDSAKKLGIENLIATTGKNRSGGTAYMPSDNRAKGIRPDGRWHDIKVKVEGYTYTLFVDSVEILTATDKDKTFYKGYTVIGSNGCIIDIDNISLTNN